MERRRDYRFAESYPLSLKCPRTRRIIGELSTKNISASGLYFESRIPLRLESGSRYELHVVARVPGQANEDVLVMATRGVVVRSSGRSAALSFDAPLAY